VALNVRERCASDRRDPHDRSNPEGSEMRTNLTTLLRPLGVALLALLLLATPAVADDDAHDDDDHHATGTAATSGASDELGSYVHEGTCDAIGATVEEIDDLELDDDDDDDRIWQRIGRDQPMPDRLWADDDDVDTSLQALMGGEHVITVHADEDSDSPVIACGAIAGELDADGGLLIDLAEVDGSGYAGRAYLIPDDDDNETDIDLGVWEAVPATPGV
jgi:hypothetical protein